jgi:hypothetical protein
VPNKNQTHLTRCVVDVLPGFEIETKMIFYLTLKRQKENASDTNIEIKKKNTFQCVIEK